MDSDDAVDVLDDLSETKKNEIVEHLDADAKEDVQKLLSYEDDEIGSCMTNNFICIPDNLTIREAMSALVKQAGEHDNISTIYVVNSADKFAGAIDLKDLIIARQNDNLADIISSSYPYVYEHEISMNVLIRLQITKRIPFLYLLMMENMRYSYCNRYS